MPRVPEGRTQLATTIPTELYDALSEYREETGIPFTRLVEDAVRALLEERTGREYPR